MTAPATDPLITALRLALAEVAARKAAERTERRSTLTVKQGGKEA